jgi:hypothetical protein
MGMTEAANRLENEASRAEARHSAAAISLAAHTPGRRTWWQPSAIPTT